MLDLKNNCNRPVIKPERFSTTVAIIAALISPLPIVCETKYGITKALNTLAGWSSNYCKVILPVTPFPVQGSKPFEKLQFSDADRSCSHSKA